MGLRNRTQYLDKKCFFVTTTCNSWKPLINQTDSYHLLEQSLTFVNSKYDSDTLGYVIMPNHLHLLLYFKKDNRLSDYMRDFKKFTSLKIRQELKIRNLIFMLDSIRTESRKRVFQVWEERFDDQYIRSRAMLEHKLDYIHENPLQDHWNLVEYPEDYTYSSASFYHSGKQPGLNVVHYKEYY